MPMASIKHHEDIVAWQLATELKEKVLEVIARTTVSKHFKFCDQIRESCRSAPANISDGFWRYRPRDNARFVRIALGSLGETANHLMDGWKEKYFDEKEYLELAELARRALATAIGWHTYLMKCPDRAPDKSAKIAAPRTQNPELNLKPN